MTVKELIKQLKEHPMNAKVAWQDHDQAEDEINAEVGNVESFDPEKSFDPAYCKGIKVVIRP